MPPLFPVPQARAAENDQRSPGDQKVTCDRPRHQLPIHPVKARPGGNEIEDSVGPVNLLRGGLDEPDIRRAPARGLALRMLQHVGIGVDRDNRGEMRQQSKEHLPRPAAQIEEALSPIEPALGYHPVQEFLRVRNTEVGVEGRCRLKDRPHGVDSGGEMTKAFCLRLLSHSRVIVRAFDAERCENAHLSGLFVPFYDVEDGILADSEVTGDPAVTSSLADGLKDLGASLSDFGRWPGRRPSFFPRAFAAASPDFTRSLIKSRSN